MKKSALLVLTLACSQAWAQADTAGNPWFGLSLPPPLAPHVSPIADAGRGTAPPLVPAGEAGFSELQGTRLAEDLQRIVEFSRQSRVNGEFGEQLWGRVSGFQSGADTVRWAAEQFRLAGIQDVREQSFSQEPDAALWLPRTWQLTLLGDSSFGEGSEDIDLQSAMVLAPSEIPGELIAPLIYVGRGSLAEIQQLDLEGKIALQHVTPQAHLVFERARAVPQARELFNRGAVAVVNLVDQPGNVQVRDFSNCGGPCFNLGGQDSWFLQQVMDQAVREGVYERLRMRLRVSSESHQGLEAVNAVAVIPGRSSDQALVVNAHADAWFDGAGDNADGLAVLLALARHFSQPDRQLRRRLVLIASAGHHTPGLNGPRNAVRMNPDLFEEALLIVNLEHVAQRNVSRARFSFADGYRQYTLDASEAPISVGITNQAPFLQGLFDQGVARYGTNFVSTDSTMASGEGGGYRSVGIPIVTTMQAPPLYHTTGEVAEVISVAGLERMARFMAFFLAQVDGAERDRLQ